MGGGYLWYGLVVDGYQFPRLRVDLQGLVECESSFEGTLRTCRNMPSVVVRVPGRPFGPFKRGAVRTFLTQYLTLRHLLHKVHLLLFYVDWESLELHLSDGLCDDFSLLGAGGGLLCSLGADMSLAVSLEGFSEFGVMATFVVKVNGVCRDREGCQRLPHLANPSHNGFNCPPAIL